MKQAVTLVSLNCFISTATEITVAVFRTMGTALLWKAAANSAAFTIMDTA